MYGHLCTFRELLSRVSDVVEVGVDAEVAEIGVDAEVAEIGVVSEVTSELEPEVEGGELIIAVIIFATFNNHTNLDMKLVPCPLFA